jgi:hypothetical protein
VLRIIFVKARTAGIFKGILESRKTAENAEKFAKTRLLSASSAAVYQAGIYHDGALREINRPLTRGPAGADGGGRPKTDLAHSKNRHQEDGCFQIFRQAILSAACGRRSEPVKRPKTKLGGRNCVPSAQQDPKPRRS